MSFNFDQIKSSKNIVMSNKEQHHHIKKWGMDNKKTHHFRGLLILTLMTLLWWAGECLQLITSYQ